MDALKYGVSDLIFRVWFALAFASVIFSACAIRPSAVPDITLTRVENLAKPAGLRAFRFPRAVFEPGSIVSVDEQRNITGSPASALKECYASSNIEVRKENGLSGEFLRAVQQGIELDASAIESLLPIKFGPKAISASHTVLRMPKTYSGLLGQAKVDDWVHEAWTQLSTGCRRTLQEPDKEVITEIIYAAKGFSISFYNSDYAEIEVSALNLGDFVRSGLDVLAGQAERNSIVFNSDLPFLYTTYKPKLPVFGEVGDLYLDVTEKELLSYMMMQSGFVPGGEYIRRLEDKSYRINRIISYIVQGKTVHSIDEINGTWVQGAPLTNEFVLGTDSTGTILEEGTFHDNLRKVPIKPVAEIHGKTHLYRLTVGNEFSITQTQTITNEFCAGKAKRDLFSAVNRFKYLESYEIRIYLDYTPSFSNSYSIDSELIPRYFGTPKIDADFAELKSLLQRVHDKKFASGIFPEQLREGLIFFRGQQIPRGVFLIGIACP